MNDWPELLQRLVTAHGYQALALDAVDDFTGADGSRLVFVTDDPKLQKEVLDLAVILPQLLRACPGAEVGVLSPYDARAASARFGTRKTPALLFWRDGDYLGAIEGLLDWAAFVREFARLLSAPPARVPSIGIAVASAAASCH